MFLSKSKKIVVIDGMMCNHCAKKVEETLNKLANVDKVKADVKKGIVTVWYHESVDVNQIKDSIKALDYKVVEIKDEKR